jgi:hypothetical protein
MTLDICPYCQRAKGLCRATICRREVLPLLAQTALYRLAGIALVEQSKRQDSRPNQRKLARIARRNARRIERKSSLLAALRTV